MVCILADWYLIFEADTNISIYMFYIRHSEPQPAVALEPQNKRAQVDTLDSNSKETK